MDFLSTVKSTSEENTVPKHTGLFYRVKISQYHSQATGVFHDRTTLTPLKRMSCKGCPTCDAIYETVSEYGVSEFLSGECEWKNGEIVELKIVGDKQWTDCGYEYDSWLEWERVRDEK